MAVYYREAQKIFSEKIAPSISSTFTQVCTIHIVPLDHISNRLGFYSPAHINRDINSFNCSLKIADIVSGPLTPMHEFGHAIHLQFLQNTIPSNIFREGIAEFVAIYEQPKKIADYCQQAQEFFRNHPNLYSKFNEILDLSYRYDQHLNGEPIYIIGALLTYYFVTIKPVMQNYLICVRDNKVEANYLQCDTQFRECNNHIRRLGELKCQNVYSECVRDNKISSIHSNAQICNTRYQQCWEEYHNRHCVNEDIKCKSNIPTAAEQLRARKNKECEQHLTAAYNKDEFKDFINNKCQNPSPAAAFAEPLQIIANCVAQKCKLLKAHFTNSMDAEKQ
ncbi:hypothetical protein [Candidatus Tisiphia endosymbiont of Nemotelus uliginosus]|uniref:hypothetical protein n=1 Tax=Candidatus Tisiphia endosymbiont of Nemotelus uliginosus TaxID=3077926 RepID=UPI0035C92C4F